MGLFRRGDKRGSAVDAAQTRIEPYLKCEYLELPRTVSLDPLTKAQELANVYVALERDILPQLPFSAGQAVASIMTKLGSLEPTACATPFDALGPVPGLLERANVTTMFRGWFLTLKPNDEAKGVIARIAPSPIPAVLTVFRLGPEEYLAAYCHPSVIEGSPAGLVLPT